MREAAAVRPADPRFAAAGGPPPRDGLMRIGQVAERTGLSLRTIRFYEEEGLVVPAARTDGGFRLYSEGDVGRFALIKRMKPLGFAVEEMRELLTVLSDLDAGHDAGHGDRAAVVDRLRMFHTAATTRLTALREQVAVAQGLADTLADRLDAHR